MVKIKSSLTAKMFIFIFIALVTISIVIYSLIMIFMPYTLNNLIYTSASMEMETLLVEIEGEEFSQDDLEKIISISSGVQDIQVQSITPDEDIENYIYSDDETATEVVASYTDNNSISISTSTYNNDGEVFFITAHQSLDSVNQASDVLIKILPAIIVCILILSISCAFFVSSYMTKPIKNINRTASLMAAKDLSVRCDTSRFDEIGTLSKSLNDIAFNLDHAIIDLRTANEALQKDIEKERILERQRRDFFGAVSHELKTPITILKGEIEGMIRGVGIFKDREKYLAHSLETTESMEVLVKEILSLSKLEDENFKIKNETVDLGIIINNVVNNFESLALNKEILLNVSIPPCLLYKADKKLIEKAISNIIGNAISYSPEGETVDICLVNNGDGAVFTVKNIGFIADEDMSKIFEPFFRIEKSRNRHTGGSGLGLYIVKIILSLHFINYSIENTKSGVVFKVIFKPLIKPL